NLAGQKLKRDVPQRPDAAERLRHAGELKSRSHWGVVARPPVATARAGGKNHTNPKRKRGWSCPSLTLRVSSQPPRRTSCPLLLSRLGWVVCGFWGGRGSGRASLTGGSAGASPSRTRYSQQDHELDIIEPPEPSARIASLRPASTDRRELPASG